MPTTIPDLSDTFDAVEPPVTNKVKRAVPLPMKEFHDEHKAWFEASAYRNADDSCAPLIYNDMIGIRPVLIGEAEKSAILEEHREELKEEIRFQAKLDALMEEMENEE